MRAIASADELAAFLSQYRRPIYGYIRRKGFREPDAEDLTQGFIADVVLTRDLIGRADRNRGRFRKYLRKALDNFARDEWRKARTGPRLIPDQEVPRSAEPLATDDPVRAFDRQWAITVLEIALERVRAECDNDEFRKHWAVFEARVLHPVQSGNKPVPAEDLVRSLELRDRDQAGSMLNTVKRMIRRTLEQVVAETVDGSTEEVKAELAHLREFLRL